MLLTPPVITDDDTKRLAQATEIANESEILAAILDSDTGVREALATILDTAISRMGGTE